MYGMWTYINKTLKKFPVYTYHPNHTPPHTHIQNTRICRWYGNSDIELRKRRNKNEALITSRDNRILDLKELNIESEYGPTINCDSGVIIIERK